MSVCMSDDRKKDFQRRPGGGNAATKAADTFPIPRSRLELEDLRGDPEKVRRFKASAGTPLVSRKPHVEALIGGAMFVAWEELKHLKEIAATRKLDPEEERQYRYLVESIVKLTREQREQQKAEAIEEMDQESLMEQAKLALKRMEDGDG